MMKDEKKVPEYIIQTAKEINNQLSSLDFPFFLFDADHVLKKVKMLMLACKKSFININLTVSLQSCLLAIFCKLLAEEGVNAKVRSADEFRIASVTGFPNNRIILSGCYKTLEDLSLAMEKDALIHVGSINEFHKLKILAASKNKPCGVSIKLSSYNEKKDSRFGITKEEYIKDILPLLSKSETLYLKGFSLYIDFHLESLAKTTDALNDWFPFLVEHMPPSGYLDIDSNFPIGSFLSNSKLEISNPEIFFRTIRDVLNTYAPEISEKWKLTFEMDICFNTENSYVVERTCCNDAQSIQTNLKNTGVPFIHNKEHSLLWLGNHDTHPNNNVQLPADLNCFENKSTHLQENHDLKEEKSFFIKDCHPSQIQALHAWTHRKPPVYIWLKGSLHTARMPSFVLSNISKDLLLQEESLYVDDNIRLEAPSRKFAPALYEIIDFNKEYFSAFMAWPRFVKHENDTVNFLDSCFIAHQKDEEKTYVILFNENPVGLLSFNSIDSVNKIGYIGYWLDKRVQGNGIITRAIKALVVYYSSHSIINRFVIKCSTANQKSNAVAKRCSFVLEGTLRQAEYLNGAFHDQNIYSWIPSDH